MSKTETLRRLSDAEVEKRVERLASQIESLRQARHQSVEDLAVTLEPLAQAMAALTDEARQTLAEIDRKSREHGETFRRQLSDLVKSYRDAAATAQRAAESLSQAGQRMRRRHYLLAVATGLTTGLATAVLVSGFWLWLAPPKVQVQSRLDAQAVAAHLKPAVIEALKLSGGR